MSDEDFEVDVEGVGEDEEQSSAALSYHASSSRSGVSTPAEDENHLDDEYSDEDVDDFSDEEGSPRKRAHHNALEKQRREDINHNYRRLKNSLPALKGKKASRCQILREASEFLLTKHAMNKQKKAQLSAINAEIARLQRIADEIAKKKEEEKNAA